MLTHGKKDGKKLLREVNNVFFRAKSKKFLQYRDFDPEKNNLSSTGKKSQHRFFFQNNQSLQYREKIPSTGIF